MTLSDSQTDTKISETEQKLLELLVTGASSKSIAEQLGLKDGTTRVYLHSLYRRIGVANKTGAATWYLERQRQQAAPLAEQSTALDIETFGDRAIETDLLSALGMMEICLGPYGRMWTMTVQLDGPNKTAQEMTLISQRSRLLWRAIVSGRFSEAAVFFDEAGVVKLFIESPSDAVVLVAALLLGGFTARAQKSLGSLKVKRGGSIGITIDERAALCAIADAVNSHQSDNALAALHRLIERSRQRPVFRHLLIVALFHLYKMRKEISLARDVANVIWVEAESAKAHLQSMGDSTFPTNVQLPSPPKLPKAEVARYLTTLTA